MPRIAAGSADLAHVACAGARPLRRIALHDAGTSRRAPAAVSRPYKQLRTVARARRPSAVAPPRSEVDFIRWSAD
jgi:hypothetical protein